VKLTRLSQKKAGKKKKKKTPFSRFVCVCARVSLDKKAKTAFCSHDAPIDTVRRRRRVLKVSFLFSRAKSEKRTRERKFSVKKKE